MGVTHEHMREGLDAMVLFAIKSVRKGFISVRLGKVTTPE